MPYPSQINRETIVQCACEMIEAHGVDQLSLHTLAKQLGVKAPSLYRYVQNKTALLRAVNEATLQALFSALRPVLEQAGDAQTRSLAVARAYRAFAHANPATYGLVYTNTIAELRPDAAEQEQAVLPFQALLAEITGEALSLSALRGFLALLHGFVMLEISGQFQRGGDLDAAFEQSINAYLAGWQARHIL